ncbi:spore germination protein [Paenibacillus montaniterrae]|uniref:Spore germination protein n=1 Tax=Paenibacillus montaniterrae TaxID=429341 RepID=A0A919YXF6_9BACL|nr:spore germination protein [Paenibacillus montaniterrae]GIP18986.1 spore germination protein [Paenibacillus montaniterrae]
MNNTQYVDMDNLTEEQFQHYYKHSADIIIFAKHYKSRQFTSPNYLHEPVKIIFVLSEVFIQNNTLKETVLPSISNVFEDTGFRSAGQMEYSPMISWFKVGTAERPIAVSKMSSLLFEGNVLCAIPHLKLIMSINIADIPTRTPEESASEITIRGPKDGLVEDIGTNIALLRKRIRSEHLYVESYSIGTLTNTKMALLYMEDIANDQMIATVKGRIDNIDTEQLVTIGQLEEMIGDKTYLFPTVDYSARPDFIVECLLNGRFVIILDNNPMVIIAPGNVFQLLKSPEDNYFPLLASNISRLFRLFALITSIFIPGFYIAITTFHPDQLPFTMLATISISRMGIPMEASIEMFLIMTFMEMFREASIRMPGSMSHTITVVGGLIIGEAAIRAGLVSPIIVVVAAISIITGAILVNQSLANSVVFYRFLAFVLSSFLGIYGFITAYIIFILFLSRLQSFGVPYLAPLSPLNLRGFLISIFQTPLRFREKRPAYLHTKKTKKDE